MPKTRLAMLCLITTVVLSLSDRFVVAQPESEFRFQHLSVQDGLSEPRVNCIHQDGTGYMWFGTGDGLNRFDGHEIVVFRPAVLDSGTPYIVTSIYEDADGFLWLGETNTEFSKFDPATGTFLEHHRYEPGNPEGLPYKTHLTIRGAPDGMLWIGTGWIGLLRFDPRSGIFSPFPHRKSTVESTIRDGVYAIYSSEPDSDIVWLGTELSGLIRLDSITGAMHWLRNDPPDTHAVTPPNTVTFIGEESPGILWVGGENAQLYRFDVQARRFLSAHRFDNGVDTAPPAPEQIFGVVRGPEGRIWVGSNNAGMAEFRLNEGFCNRLRYDATDRQSLSNNLVTQLYRDRSGVVWVATKRDGVSFFDPRAGWIRHDTLKDENGRYSNPTFVQCFYQEDGDIVWLGSGAGLTRWNRRLNQYRYYRHPHVDGLPGSPNAITCFSARTKGGFWIGSQGGLSRYDPVTDQMIRVESPAGGIDDFSRCSIRAVHEDRHGRVWIGALPAIHRSPGLLRYDPESRDVKAYRHDPGDAESVGPGMVTRIHEDRQGRLWFASHMGGKGISRFDRQTGRFIRYQHDPADPNSIRDDFVKAFHEDREQDVLWIGTNSGLDRIAIGPQADLREFEHINLGDANDEILGIEQDDSGALWLASKSGLRLMANRDQATVDAAVVAPDTANRFQLLNDSYFKLHSGEILIGSRTGFFEIQPDRFHPGEPPPVVLTQVRARGNSRTAPTEMKADSERIVLSHEQNNVLSIKFAALDFTEPRQNRYAYRLEGLEQDWSDVSDRHTASYTTLPAGEYVFHVMAANSQGVWNEEGASLAIKVLPPWWAIWWFRLLLLALTAGLVFGLVAYRSRDLRERNRLLGESDDRYLNLLTNTTEQLWCVEFDQPVALDLPEMEQVERIFNARVVQANEAFAKAYGATLEEVLRWRVRDFIPRDFPTSVPFLLHAVRSGYRMEGAETTERAVDGSTKRFVNNFIGTIKDNHVLRVWGVCRDVTESKRADELIKQQRNELMHVSRVATLGEIGAAMAHELSQPLAAVLRNAQAGRRMLNNGNTASEEIREILEDIVRDNERAGKVLERIRQHLQQIDRPLVIVNVNDVVTESIALLKSELLMHGLSVELRLTPDLPPVEGDPIELQQVIINLVMNAEQVMKNAETAEREILIESKLDRDGHIKVSVNDSGPGIHERDLERVFVPFHSTRKEGMGMGLAINRTIINAHNGKIWAEQKGEKAGAKIVFTIPTLVEPATNESAAV